MKINELEIAFQKIDLSKWNKTNLDCATILDAQKFVNRHIRIYTANKDNEEFLPYYERLMQFYKIITE